MRLEKGLTMDTLSAMKAFRHCSQGPRACGEAGAGFVGPRSSELNLIAASTSTVPTVASPTRAWAQVGRRLTIKAAVSVCTMSPC
jgi:hypothetical protein